MKNAHTPGAVIETLVSLLTLSHDVPQFKADAGSNGVTQGAKLEGRYSRALASPIQVWQRHDGRLEVISGRHRLDLAQRSGEATIPAQIHLEADGFNADNARMLDIELNVKDGRGKVRDYVTYFKEFKLTADQARADGLLNTAIGRNAHTIAQHGSATLCAAHANGAIGDEAAVSISQNAPENEALQNLGMQQVANGKTINHAVNVMRAARAAGFEGGDSGDMFGFDDSFAKEAEAIAKEAGKQQGAIRQQLAAMRGASKRPELAAKGGIDIKDLAATHALISTLQAQLSALEGFSTDPEIYRRLRVAAGLFCAPAPDDFLVAPSVQDVLQQQERAESAAKENKAQQRAADEMARRERERLDIKNASEWAADTFVLGGDAEQNLSGQGSFFDAPDSVIDTVIDAHIAMMAAQDVAQVVATAQAGAAIEHAQATATACEAPASEVQELATVCEGEASQPQGVSMGSTSGSTPAPAPVSSSEIAGGGRGRQFQTETSASMNPDDFAGDISESLAVAAYSGTSFSPERRGASIRSDYAQTMAEDWAYLHAQAVKGGTLDQLPTEFARYRASMAGRYRAWLASSSRCVSSFIAGPSNFPAARMNKRADIAHKRLTECVEGREMARRAAARKLRPDLRVIMAGDADATDRLAAKIAAAQRHQDNMKAANKAIRTNEKHGHARQVAALLELGHTEAQAVALIKPDYCGRVGFPSYSLTNNNANIRRMTERLAQIEAAQATEVTQTEGADGVQLEDDAPANRVRLYFPGKPSAEIRDTLKSSGFRWAPSIGAWQAYRNYSSLQTAQQIAGTPAPAPAEELAPAPAAPVEETTASPETSAPEIVGGGEGQLFQMESSEAAAAPVFSGQLCHTLTEEIFYSTPVMKIGQHEWVTQVFQSEYNGRCTRSLWRYTQGERTKEYSQKYPGNYSPKIHTAVKGVWYPHEKWASYDSNDGSFGGLPKTLRNLFYAYEAAIQAALTEPAPTQPPASTPETAPAPATQPAEPATIMTPEKAPAAAPALAITLEDFTAETEKHGISVDYADTVGGLIVWATIFKGEFRARISDKYGSYWSIEGNGDFDFTVASESLAYVLQQFASAATLPPAPTPLPAPETAPAHRQQAASKSGAWTAQLYKTAGAFSLDFMPRDTQAATSHHATGRDRMATLQALAREADKPAQTPEPSPTAPAPASEKSQASSVTSPEPIQPASASMAPAEASPSLAAIEQPAATGVEGVAGFNLISAPAPGALSITITRAEGPASECGQPATTVASFAQADTLLSGWANSVRKGSSDKCDFVIHWPDGGTYSGTYDLKHPSAAPASLAQHLIDIAEYMLGKFCPLHLSEADYRASLKCVSPEAQSAYTEILAMMADMGAYSPKARPAIIDPQDLIAHGMPVEDLAGLGVIYCSHDDSPAPGAIVAAEATQWGLKITVRTEDGIEHHAGRQEFRSGLYRVDFKRHGAPYLAQLDSAAAMRKARDTSAAELAKQAHASALATLATEYSHLQQSQEGGKLSGVTLAAANVRILLKRQFPGIKFSVKSSSYSMGNSLSVRWTDGPTAQCVDDIVGLFSGGNFDGMTDSYKSTTSAFTELFGSAKHTDTSREASDALVQAALDQHYEGMADAPTVADYRNHTGRLSWEQGSDRRHFDDTLSATTR